MITPVSSPHGSPQLSPLPSPRVSPKEIPFEDFKDTLANASSSSDELENLSSLPIDYTPPASPVLKGKSIRCLNDPEPKHIYEPEKPKVKFLWGVPSCDNFCCRSARFVRELARKIASLFMRIVVNLDFFGWSLATSQRGWTSQQP